MTKSEKDNVLNFPSNLSQAEKEVEALLFAAAEPLDISKICAVPVIFSWTSGANNPDILCLM
tara:strand:+ start:538 stop:723 length:186 start_codon:yes stop_codon:yes gene_type:complete